MGMKAIIDIDSILGKNPISDGVFSRLTGAGNRVESSCCWEAMMTLKMYSAPWCVVCRTSKPMFEALVIRDVSCRVLDVEKDEEGIGDARKYGITTLPTFVLEDDLGNEIDRRMGPATSSDLLKLCNSAKV